MTGEAAERAIALLGRIVTADDTGLTAALTAAAVAGDEEATLLLDRQGAREYLAVDSAPAQWLPWLATVVGGRLAPATTEQQQRAEVRNPVGWRRGLPDSVIETVRRYMVAPYRVTLRERTNPAAAGVDDADHVLLQVQASDVQAGREAELEAAFHAALPVDLTGHVVITDQRTYADVADLGAYQDVLDVGTYDDLLNP